MQRKRLHTGRDFPGGRLMQISRYSPPPLQRERRDAGNWRDFLLGVYFLHRIGDKVIQRQEAGEVAFPRG